MLVCPTAAAHEGDESYDGWANKGLEHYGALGIAAEVLPLKTRDDAIRDEVVARLDDASADLLLRRQPRPARPGGRRHAVLGRAPDGAPRRPAVCGVQRRRGMPHREDLRLGPSGLRLDLGARASGTCGTRCSDRTGTSSTRGSRARPTFIAGSVGPGQTFIGLDEDTAMVGDGARWEVIGRAKVHVLRDGEWTRYADGDAFELAVAPRGRSGVTARGSAAGLGRDAPIEQRAPEIIRILSEAYPGREGRPPLLEPARDARRDDPVGPVHRREGERGHRHPVREVPDRGGLPARSPRTS